LMKSSESTTAAVNLHLLWHIHQLDDLNYIEQSARSQCPLGIFCRISCVKNGFGRLGQEADVGHPVAWKLDNHR